MRKLLILAIFIFAFNLFQFSTAKQLINREINPTINAVGHNELGLDYLNKGLYFAAIQEFKIAIELSPKSSATASYFNNLGLVYLKIGRLDWAQQCFEKAIEINPNFFEYYKNLVNTIDAVGSLEYGIDSYSAKVRNDIEDSRSWLVLGLMYVKAGDKTGATACFKEFKKLEPDKAFAPAVDNLINSLK